MTFIAHGADIAHALRGGQRGTDDADRTTFVPVPPDAARAITAPTHGQRFDYETENFVVSVHNGDDVITADDLALPVTGSKGNPGMVAYRKSHRASSPDDAEDWIEDEIANTLDASGHGPRTAQAVVTPIDLRSATRTDGSGMGTPGTGVGAAGDPSPTVMNMPPPAVGTGAMVRRLTPKECERLQGFPDDWTLLRDDGRTLSDSARYRLLGNAVCTAVSRWAGGRLAVVDRRLSA
jgi:site-specific DNA-cytosine methylase